MAIELEVMSGSRAGECLRFDQREITIGQVAGSLLYFDPQHEVGVEGRQATLVLGDTGWSLRNSGLGSWWINQERVVPGEMARLKSGDVVRVTEDGPDMVFNIVSDSRPTSGAQPAELAQTRLGDPTTPSAVPPELPPEGASPATIFTAAGAADSDMPIRAASATMEPRRASDVPAQERASTAMAPMLVMSVGLGAVALAALSLAMYAILRSSSPSEVVTMADEQKTASAVDENPMRSFASTAAPELSERQTDLAPLTDAQILEKHRDAVVWLGLELRGHRFPVCTAWAYSPHHAITTGREANLLMEARATGASLFAWNEDTSKDPLPIDKVFCHPKFNSESPGSEQSLFHNVGLATFSKPLPETIPALSMETLKTRPNNLELAILGYEMQGDATPKEFDRLNAPRLIVRRSAISDTRAPTSRQETWPLLILSGDIPLGLDGAAAFGPSGRAIGLVLRLERKAYVVPSDHFQQLLQDATARR